MTILNITASDVPRATLVAHFWDAWHRMCVQHFGDDAPTHRSIEALKVSVQTGAMFTHLNEGLEELLLNDRAHQSLALTPQASLSLTWLVLNDALVKCAIDDRRNMLDTLYPHVIAVVHKTNRLYGNSNGAPIAGVSMKQWIERGPWWSDNQVFWSMLFHQQLTLVHPEKTRLFWAMREHWCAANPERDIEAMVDNFWMGDVDLSSWGFPIELTVANVQHVFRNTKRWTRNESTMQDAIVLCENTPQWTGVYLLALWLRQDECEENNRLVRPYLVPDNPAYWLALSHLDKDVMTTFGLDTEKDYSAHINIIEGLQLLEDIAPIELALTAYARWQHNATIPVLPLPEL